MFNDRNLTQKELAREKAIEIMERIAEHLHKPKIFDCQKGNTTWYDIEDIITDIISRKERR